MSDETKGNSPYCMELSLNVLEHLGINLYSNIPSVLSEVVANAWDADASTVLITLDRTNDQIIIQDDGLGMTRNDVNQRFLKVGYRRRDQQPGLTPKGRAPMGRKGIGKLSLFSIADTIDVYTIKNGEKSALRMNLPQIRERIKDGDGSYGPEQLDHDLIDFNNGTKIILNNLRRQQTIRTSESLRRRLARRFSIIGPQSGFCVNVDGADIEPKDRDYYDKIQYLWTYGDQKEIENVCTNATTKEDRSSFVCEKEPKVTGWLGTVKEVGALKDEHGDNLNRIAVFIRGKMAQEDMLSSFTERGVYASYLIGELRVDDLDVDNLEDAATSSRQSIVEDDPRYEKLKQIIGSELKHIQSRWSSLRDEDGTKKALEIPAVKDWMDNLSKDLKPRAKRWLGKINRIRMDDVSEQKQLIKHAILAFEFFRCNENLEKLEQIAENNISAALEIFRELDGLEANLYGQIVQQRISVIKTLQQKVDENVLEKVIQEYIFNHLWLIDPAWERADAPALIETRVEELFKDIDASLTKEERAARIDIQYRKTAGEHVVIELKRPNVSVKLDDLTKQIRKYRNGVLKLLRDAGRGDEPVEFILLLGKNPPEHREPEGPEQIKGALDPLRARIVLYDHLLDDAYESYKEYMKKRNTLDVLDKIIRAIDDYAPPNPS